MLADFVCFFSFSFSTVFIAEFGRASCIIVLQENTFVKMFSFVNLHTKANNFFLWLEIEEIIVIVPAHMVNARKRHVKG